MRALSFGILCLLAAFDEPASMGRAASLTQDSPAQPRIGLVLSGGGARGAAHIGVLKVIEELRIPVHFVAGTSMGSIVGGLYAAGMSPEEIEEAVHAIDWSSAFEDSPPRSERSYRRKQDDRKSLIRFRLHMRGTDIRLPMGVIPAQKLTNILKFYEHRMAASTDFERLPIPFRAVAADVNTGEAVVLDHGSLALAMRASMSIPGAFPPVEIDGRLLVDGGVAANIPIAPAIDRPVDVIIAVDISTPVEQQNPPDSYLGVVQRLTGFLTRGSVLRQLELLDDDDILLTPELGGIAAASFDRLDEAIRIGEQTARMLSGSLARLSVDEDSYAGWQTSQRRPVRSTPVIESILVDNHGPLSDDVIRGQISQREGQRLDVERAMDDLSYLFGMDIFEPIEAEVDWIDEERANLVVRPHTTRMGTSILQLGIAFEDDFAGGNSYQLSARYQRLAVNRRGAEWRNDLDMGFVSGVRTEFYQPIDSRLHYFIQPYAQLRRESLDLILQGESVFEFGITSWGGGLDLGRNLGRWGQLTVGANRTRAEVEITTGLPVTESDTVDLFEGRVGVEVDTYDQVSWPSYGMFLQAELNAGATWLGGDTRTTRAEGFVEHAFSLGRTTLLPAAELGYALNGAQTGEGMILGGLFRLSGYQPYELFDARGILLRVRLYRRLNERTLALLQPGWYVGGSVEAGEVYGAGQKVSLDALRWGGSVYVGADTPIGPLFLGLGLAEEGRRRVYFAVGRNFTGQRGLQ